MDNPEVPAVETDIVIDLTDGAPPLPAHRLAELVDALIDCGIEAAELAVNDPKPARQVSQDEALDTVARAIVEVRSGQLAGSPPPSG